MFTQSVLLLLKYKICSTSGYLVASNEIVDQSEVISICVKCEHWFLLKIYEVEFESILLFINNEIAHRLITINNNLFNIFASLIFFFVQVIITMNPENQAKDDSYSAGVFTIHTEEQLVS